MLEVYVDTNSLVGEDLVRGSRRRLKASPTIGQAVLVDDVSDDARYYGTVTEVDEKSVTVKIDWSSRMIDLGAATVFRDMVHRGTFHMRPDGEEKSSGTGHVAVHPRRSELGSKLVGSYL